METVNVIFVRFDKDQIDYKQIVNSYPIKLFLESAFGDFPNPISPKKYTFDRDVLGRYIQDQYNSSKEYVVETRSIPASINPGFTLKEFEPNVLLDDHLVTVNSGDKVLGVFATEDDFGKIVNELILQNIPNTMDVEDQEEFDKFCKYANEHINEFL